MIRGYQAIMKTLFPVGEQRIIPTYGKHEGVKLVDCQDYGRGKTYIGIHEKYLPERLGGHQVYHLQDRDICPRVDNTTGRVLAVNRIKICLYLRFYRIIFLDKTRI